MIAFSRPLPAEPFVVPVPCTVEQAKVMIGVALMFLGDAYELAEKQQEPHVTH